MQHYTYCSISLPPILFGYTINRVTNNPFTHVIKERNEGIIRRVHMLLLSVEHEKNMKEKNEGSR
jgi:hypothetical protein